MDKLSNYETLHTSTTPSYANTIGFEKLVVRGAVSKNILYYQYFEQYGNKSKKIVVRDSHPYLPAC